MGPQEMMLAAMLLRQQNEINEFEKSDYDKTYSYRQTKKENKIIKKISSIFKK